MLNTFGTIITGVFVFVLGQIALKLIIEPIQRLRETIAKIAFHLINDDDVIHGAGTIEKERIETVSSNLRQLGAQLISSQCLIPFYDQLKKVFSFPDKPQIEKAAKRLSQIPAHIYGDEPEKHEKLDSYRSEIFNLLRIPDPRSNEKSKQ